MLNRTNIIIIKLHVYELLIQYLGCSEYSLCINNCFIDDKNKLYD